MECFLKEQGYKLGQVRKPTSSACYTHTFRTQGSLRRRFGAAYNWYSVLYDMAHAQIQAIVDGACESSGVLRTLETTPESSDVLHTLGTTPERPDSPGGSELPLANPEMRPTEYLCQRCPLCFGGRVCCELGDR
jgi:hypothetical protein